LHTLDRVSEARPRQTPRAGFTQRISYQVKEPMGEIIDKVKGKIKQAAGNLSGDGKLQNEGKVDSAKGKAKGAVEDVKHPA
jgi:uncharacterized protein YjbJ (UPF0337 family)